MKYLLFLFYISFVNSNQICNTVYQIFLPSFKDSNGDGIGDINGLVSELDYIRDEGFDCIQITPCLKSGNKYSGYDVTDYKEIDRNYGTMQDFDWMMVELDRRNLKLIIDLVINHSSDQHKWFQLSIDRVDPYTDFYVWANPKSNEQNNNRVAPTNWLNVFSGGAWSWNEKRGQFYYHTFDGSQPDLNLRNSQLIEEIKGIITFWVDKGIAAIRWDAGQHFIEDKDLRDEPPHDSNKKNLRYDDLNHIYTSNIQETFEFVRKIRDFTEEYTRKKGLDEVYFFIEATQANQEQLKKYYEIKTYPYNFALMNIYGWPNAHNYIDLISHWNQNVPQGATSNWMAENPDSWRISSRFSDEYAGIITMLMMVLPGIAFIYYGQEIGMRNFIAPNIEYDIGKRLPMQWNGSKNSGFSTKEELTAPVNPDYWGTNVQSEKEDKSSQLYVFKKLMSLRKTKTMKLGALKMHVISNWVFAVVREGDIITYVTIINCGIKTENVDLSNIFKNVSRFKVEVGTTNSGYPKAYRITSSRVFQLRPLSGMVLSWNKEMLS